ncbi:superoxide dismutase [Vulgatibacter incomptus]|uniref:superoxide dismutase n=1 Tax=Vulgatibacter incomptus TaxID=1391653 RepID=A0A0K1PI80_9BACT|nr:superoxide dismutase [Vulgatibacter incomptus]AKU93243.1 Superoxide dismutase [Vulgatibacter incomptus]
MGDDRELDSMDVKNPERRRLLGLMAGTAIAAPVLGLGAIASAEKAAPPPAGAGKNAPPPAAAPGTMGQKEYTLPPLPYAYEALDGYLSAEILHLHHDVHHAAYVKGLNTAAAGLADARKKGDFAQIKALERAMEFNGSGHVLHSLYWNSMSPQGGGQPTGVLKTAIEASFGSVDAFRGQFAAAAKAAEASAWGVLAYEPLGDRLVVVAAENHQNMGFQGVQPLLCCDVWEHAYYLRYKADRASYVDRFFDVINWGSAEQRLRAVRPA